MIIKPPARPTLEHTHLRLGVFGGCLLLLLMSGLMPVPVTAEPEPVNKVILRINDRIATLYDYLARRADMRNAVLRSQLAPEERERALAEIPQRVMRDLFQETLLLSRADQKGVFVDEGRIDQEISRLRGELGMEDDAVFESALGEVGLSMEKYRSQVEANLMMNEVIADEVRAMATVTEDDLRQYYRAHPEEFRVPEKRHTRDLVVLDSSDLDSAARRDLAGRLRLSLAAGESLEELAEVHSAEGRTSGALDLGAVQRGDLTPELEAALWDLEPGEYSEPVSSRGGYHILYLESVEESSLRDFIEVRDELYRQEGNRRYNEAMAQYLADLEKLAYIVEDIPADAAGYRVIRPSVPGVREPFKILGETETGDADDSLRTSPQPEAEEGSRSGDPR